MVELGEEVSGEMVGMQLVNMGAEVIKIEPPGGALSRHIGPYVDDVPDPERSLSYWYYNSGKRSVLLNMAQADHRRAFERLLDQADVLLSSLHPIELAPLDLDLAALSGARPSVIVVASSTRPPGRLHSPRRGGCPRWTSKTCSEPRQITAPTARIGHEIAIWVG